MSDNNETLLRYSDQLIEVNVNVATKFEARKKSDLPSLDNKPTVEELLNVIFPPRILEIEGRTYQNPVCHE
jgi:hypothetical protein